MNTEEAIALLDAELSRFRSCPYADLVRLMSDPLLDIERTGASGAKYQIVIQAFWDNRPDGNVRVLASIDDRGWRGFVPLNRDFIKAPDESFVGE